MNFSPFEPQPNPYEPPRIISPDADLVVDAELDTSEIHPFKTIWLHPRRTVRQLVAVNPELHVVALMCLMGIDNALDRAALRNQGDKWPTSTILGLAIVFGPLGGLFCLWLLSHLLRFTGGWIGGTAPREALRTAIAWAQVPAVFGLTLWIPELLIFGSEMFTMETPRIDANRALLISLLLMGVVETVLGIWSFVLLCNTVAEVQGFRSAWMGLVNLLISGLVLIGPLIIVAVLVAAVLGPRL